MNCSELNERIADYLFGEVNGADQEAIEAHLRACQRCAQEAVSLGATRALLGRWYEPHTPSDVDALLDRASSQSPRTARVPRRGLDLRAAVVGTAAGVAAFLLVSQVPTGWIVIGNRHEADAAGRQYLLLLYQEPAGPLSTQEREQRVAEYSAWASAGRRDGTIVMGAKLASLRHHLPDADPDPPSTSEPGGDGDIVVGYFRIAADSTDEALKIARTCPHLKYGGRVELRPIDDKPRDGRDSKTG